jgi:hypothetical protein
MAAGGERTEPGGKKGARQGFLDEGRLFSGAKPLSRKKYKKIR